MKSILFSEPISFRDTCNRQHFTTAHFAEFITYHVKEHTVTFTYVCSQCLEALGDEAEIEVITTPVKDWVRFTNQTIGEGN